MSQLKDDSVIMTVEMKTCCEAIFITTVNVLVRQIQGCQSKKIVYTETQVSK